MLKILPFASLIVSLAVAAPAVAGAADRCEPAPRDQWLTKEAIKTKAEGMGYEVRSVKIEKGCYEIYAIDKTGAKVERYLSPVTGEAVNIKSED